MEVKINLGCGKDIRKGWINVDKLELPGVDIVHDLNKFPYPFPDNFADYILMNHILEHLDDVIAVMEEIYRILKPKAIVEIAVPYYKWKGAFKDPTHKHFFTPDSMDYFTEGFKWNFYTKARFKILKVWVYRNTFPFWHLRKYFGIDMRLPVFPTNIRWIMEVVK